MGGDMTMADPASLLSYRRSKILDIDGVPVRLMELMTDEAASIWPELVAAEHSKEALGAFASIVYLGAYREDSDARLFESAAAVRKLPVRVLVPLADAIMELSDMELDSGKVQGDQAD